MQRILLLFTLLISATITNAASLDGEWEGSGYLLLRESSKNYEACELTTITMTWVGQDLLVSGWDTCMINWGIEPLSFVGGQIFHKDLVIGNYTHLGFQFEYRSPDTGLMYSSHAWLEGDTLVMEEMLDVPGLWWSKGYYKLQRK